MGVSRLFLAIQRFNARPAPPAARRGAPPIGIKVMGRKIRTSSHHWRPRKSAKAPRFPGGLGGVGGAGGGGGHPGGGRWAPGQTLIPLKFSAVAEPAFFPPPWWGLPTRFSTTPSSPPLVSW